MTLKRIAPKTEADDMDPVASSIMLLFSTKESDPQFRKIQKRTAWLFCLSMLALIVARACD